MKATPVERWLLSFWPLQLGGWIGYAAANLAALLPSRHAQDYVAYRSMYLAVGFVGSFLMYPLCRWLRRQRVNLLRGLLVCIAFGYLLAIPASVAITWTEVRFGGAHTPLRWSTVFANAVGVAFVYAAWSAFYFGIKHYQESEESRVRLQASEALAREAQLCALRYQMQPHFLFNTLNAISTLVLTDKPKQATQMIARLAGLLRLTLDAPHTHEVPLEEELALIAEYLRIEQVRFGDGLTVCYSIPPEALSMFVPRFLLQPLVENAIHHGISRRVGGGEIAISAEATRTELMIAIENQTGHNKKARSVCFGGSGLGLSNTRLRLQELYAEAASLSTEILPSTNYRATVRLPIVVRLASEEVT